MAVVDTITFLLRADVGQFQNGLNGARESVNRVGTASVGASRGVTIMRSGLSALALEATGVSGPVGRLSQGLLLFAGGSSLVLGVVAGVAVIATAYRALTREAREAAAQIRDVIKAQQERVTARAGPAGVGQAEIGILNEQRSRILRDISRVGERLREARRRGPGMEGDLAIGPILAERAALRDMVTLYGQLKENTDRLAMSAGLVADAHDDSRDALLGEREELQKAADVAQKLAVATTNAAAHQIWLRAKAAAIEFKTALGDAAIAARALDQAAFDAAKQSIQTLKSKMRDMGPAINDTMQNLGREAVRSFVTGIMDGTADFFDLLAQVLKQFLVGTLLDAIFGTISGKAGLGSTAGSGREIGELSPSLMGATAAPSMNLSVNLPPARSPFDISRDADWQRALRASLTVAYDGGFRR